MQFRTGCWVLALWLFLGGEVLPADESKEEVRPPAPLPEVNVRYMLRGYCFVEGIAGIDRDSQRPSTLERDSEKVAAALRLNAHVDRAVRFGHRTGYAGFELELRNAGTTPIEIDTMDGRLWIVQEALDSQGHWRAIEYLPGSW